VPQNRYLASTSLTTDPTGKAPVSRKYESAMSNLRLRCSLHLRSPPGMPREDALDRSTRGHRFDVMSTQMVANHLSTDPSRLAWR
jgi:hypothetical protein